MTEMLRDKAMLALWGGSVIKSVVVAKTLTDDERRAMEDWLRKELRMYHLRGALVFAPDGEVYSYVPLPHPEWTPVELGDKLVGWWEKDGGNIFGTVVEDSWI